MEGLVALGYDEMIPTSSGVIPMTDDDAAASNLPDEPFPYDPLTEEEIERLVTDIHGTPILEIIAEFERRLRDETEPA